MIKKIIKSILFLIFHLPILSVFFLIAYVFEIVEYGFKSGRYYANKFMEEDLRF